MVNSKINELQSQLYLESLYLTLSQEEGWLTKRYEERWHSVEEQVREWCLEENMDLSFCSTEEMKQWMIRKNVEDAYSRRGEILKEWKRSDFERFALLAYCCQVFNDAESAEMVKETRDLLNADCGIIDVTKVDAVALHNFCKHGLISDSLDAGHHFYDISSLIDVVDTENQSTIELDSFVYEKSEKWISYRNAYLYYYWYNKLVGTETQVRFLGADSSIDDLRQFDNVVLNIENLDSSIADDNLLALVKEKMNLWSKGGSFIIRGGSAILKEAGRSLRKFVCEEHLLSYCISGDPNHCLMILARRSSSAPVHLFVSSFFRGISLNCLDYYRIASFDLLKRLDYNILDISGYDDRAILSGGNRNASFNDMFDHRVGVDHEESFGRVFVGENVAKDFDSFVCDVDSLTFGPVDKDWTKVVSPVLVFSHFHPVKVTYVKASMENPVFVAPKMLATRINEDVVLPEYVCLLWQKGLLQKFGVDWLDCIPEEDGTFSADFILGVGSVLIPSSQEEQRRQYEDAYLTWQVLSNREKSLERLLHFQEWQSESHIRNIKHRLSDEMTPLTIGVEGLKALLDRNSLLKADDIYGRRSGMTVKGLIDSLVLTVHKVIESINDLTRVDKVSSDELEVYDLNEVVAKYVSTTPWASKCKLVSSCSEKALPISISEKCMTELFDYLVENAVRHGFTDSSRSDYTVRFEIRKKDDISCELLVSNNGVPMCENAQTKYFVRGGYVGQTGHSGIGGARVMDIVKSLGGEVALQCDENADFPVVIRMSFPLVSNL